MAIDMEAIRRKMAKLNGTDTGDNKGGYQSSIKLWKPEVGQHAVRVLPWQHLQGGEVFEERKFYYLGDDSCLVPPEGAEDPIGSFRMNIYKTTKAGDPLREVAKKFWPKESNYIALIDRAHPEEGPYLQKLTKDETLRLLGFFEKKGVGDWMDLQSGCDLDVTVANSGKKFKGKDVLNKTWDLDLTTRGPAHEDPEVIKGWLAKLPSVDEFVSSKKLSVQAMKDMVERFLTAPPEADTSPAVISKPGTSKFDKPIVVATVAGGKAPKEKIAPKTALNLDEALADLERESSLELKSCSSKWWKGM